MMYAKSNTCISMVSGEAKGRERARRERKTRETRKTKIERQTENSNETMHIYDFILILTKQKYVF